MPLSKYRVIDVMQQSIALADPAGPIRQVFADMATAEHGCFVVVDRQQHPVGIITEGDVIRMVSASRSRGATT